MSAQAQSRRLPPPALHARSCPQQRALHTPGRERQHMPESENRHEKPETEAPAIYEHRAYSAILK